MSLSASVVPGVHDTRHMHATRTKGGWSGQTWISSARLYINGPVQAHADGRVHTVGVERSGKAVENAPVKLGGLQSAGVREIEDVRGFCMLYKLPITRICTLAVKTN